MQGVPLEREGACRLRAEHAGSELSFDLGSDHQGACWLVLGQGVLGPGLLPLVIVVPVDDGCAVLHQKLDRVHVPL